MSRRSNNVVKPIVLFIDDWHVMMKNYVSAIRDRGFEVWERAGPDDGLEAAEEAGPNVAAIVLDIMMPWGKRFSATETENGLITGLKLYPLLRKACPRAAIAILTNVRDEALKNVKESARLKLCQKSDYPPKPVAELLARIVSLPAWLTETEEQIERTQSLTGPQVARAASYVLGQTVKTSIPPPILTPRPNGLMLEWRSDRALVRLDLTDPHSVRVKYKRQESTEWEEFSCGLAELDRVRDLLQGLASPDERNPGDGPDDPALEKATVAAHPSNPGSAGLEVQAIGGETLRRELPRLMVRFRGAWVAAHGERLVGPVNDKRELYRRMQSQGCPLVEVVVLQVGHDRPAIDLRRRVRIVKE